MRWLRVHISIVSLGAVLTLAGCPAQEPGPSAGAVQPPIASTPTPPPPPMAVAQPTDEVVATIDGLDITMQQLQGPLVEAFGLNMLLKIVELDLAKQQASRLGIRLTSSDVSAETQRYLDQVFKDDKHISDLRDDLDQKNRVGKIADAEQDRRSIIQEQQRLLAQLLENQKLTRVEFDLALETTAYMRAIVQPAVQAKLTDENLQESFRARYGEKVQVRHVACANLQEVAEVKRHLANGESFAQVAELYSRNRQTGASGGELPPFSRTTPGLPQVFKDTAFALVKPGDISDPVEADGAYHLIQLQERIAPTAVKFDDVKQSVREDLAEALTEAAVKQIRAQLGQQALKDLRIQNQVLAKQFEDKVTQRDTEIRDRDQIRRQLKSERDALPTSAPATGVPATSATTQVTGAAPATEPAAATEPAPEATAAPASTSPSTRP